MSEIDTSFPMYVVYRDARDYPGRYVVRVHYPQPDGTVAAAPELFANAATLDAARARLPRGLFHIPRDPRDEPHIVELWI